MTEINWVPGAFTLGSPIITGNFVPAPTAAFIDPNTVRLTMPVGTVAAMSSAQVIIPFDTSEVADPDHAQHKLTVNMGPGPVTVKCGLSMSRTSYVITDMIHHLSNGAPSLATGTSLETGGSGQPARVEGLKDWLDSPTRALILVFGTSFMEASTFNGETIDVHVSLFKQEASAPPSALHFRDPADGVFKPLTGIDVRGFPCEPSGPQAPSTPALGRWTYEKSGYAATAGAMSSPGAVSEVGAAAIYINPVDAAGTDRLDALRAGAAGSILTLKQGDTVVTLRVTNPFSDMLKNIGVAWVTGGPWMLTAGPTDVWIVAP